MQMYTKTLQFRNLELMCRAFLSVTLNSGRTKLKTLGEKRKNKNSSFWLSESCTVFWDTHYIIRCILSQISSKGIETKM